jgi:hypothetical protein
MKKILSLTLAVVLLVSAIPTAFAADQDYSLGTAVTVTGAGGEYTVTVPATLIPGQTGTVTAKGYWAADNTLKVTAPETIEVTNTETNQKATINVDFDGIESLGDDLEELTKTASISVDKGNTKFGTWTGTIVYNVELVEPPAPTLITFTIDGTEYQAEEGMTWKEWTATDYNPSTSGISKPIPGVTVYKTEGSYKLAQSGGAQLNSNDVIIAGHAYTWSST